LLVCLGNICRSPTAEGVLRDVLAREAPDLAVEIDSAGTAAYHVGHPPDPRSQRAALRRGIDLSGLRARQVTLEDFANFDLILAMDRNNLGELQSLRPKPARATVGLFLEYAADADTLEVPDPYYGGAEGFERVIELTTSASRGLVHALRQQGSSSPVGAAALGQAGGFTGTCAAASTVRPPRRWTPAG
jgi:protein-tyrosine phosphatase